jgi:hypothetical protein
MNQMKQRSYPASVTMSLCALALCGAWLSAPVQARQSSPQRSTTAQAMTAQPTTAAPQQGAATRRQTQKTDQANRAVEDETSTAAQAARTAQSETAQFEAAQRRAGSAGGAPSYGPVLAPRGQAQDPARKDPAEVHDETDSLTRPAAGQPDQSAQPADPADPAGAQRRKPNPNLRRPAWQPATEPMAPRPLRPAVAVDPAGAAAAAAPAVPVPIPAAPPRTQLPRPAVIGSCQGNSCLDTNGQRYNGLGTGAASVNSSGRLCTRTGISVQCF